MAGPIQATSPDDGPMTSTRRPITPAASPRQPPWATPIRALLRSAMATGTQSAVCITRPRLAASVQAASASGAVEQLSRPAGTQRLPCTWRSHCRCPEVPTVAFRSHSRPGEVSGTDVGSPASTPRSAWAIASVSREVVSTLTRPVNGQLASIHPARTSPAFTRDSPGPAATPQPVPPGPAAAAPRRRSARRRRDGRIRARRRAMPAA